MTGPESDPGLGPQVIRLLTGILGTLQRLEAAQRDIYLRLGWPAAHPSPAPPVRGISTGSGVPATFHLKAGPWPPEVEKQRAGLRAVHTPAGSKAAERMRALQSKLNISGMQLAALLGIPQSTISKIQRNKAGISYHVHDLMTKVETERGIK